MAGELVTIATIRAHDQLTGPLMAMAARVRSIQSGVSAHMQKIGNAVVPVVQPGAAAFGLQQLIQNTKESATLAWEANAALLAGTLDDEALDTEAKKLDAARAKAEELRNEAMKLSASLGLMPEAFQKSGAEALKMGVDLTRAKAIMRASGLVNLSDREADPAVMTKALGTYDILYGEGNPLHRGSQLALAGAKTRTSASKIEEGLRNFMGVHGAFGGRFEDGVALTAMGSQLGQFEKETGTALKSLMTRFLRMPAEGRAALAAAGIDISKFMDFAAADPTRATNQIIQAFPQQLAKGARGSLSKFFEKAQRDGRMNDPAIINEALAHLEKLGLKFAGDQDREAATAKLGSILHGAGGRFDPIALLQEVNQAISEGRAGEGIWSAIGEPKRLHQYAGFRKIMTDLLALREQLVNDKGQYLELVEKGRLGSDIDKLSRLESAVRRFQISLVRSDAVQSFVGTLANLAERIERADPAIQRAAGWGAVMLAIGGPALVAARALTAIGAASTAALLGLGRFAAIPFVAAASGLRSLALGLTMFGIAGSGAAVAAGGMALTLSRIVGFFGTLMRFGVAGLAAGGILAMIMGPESAIQAFSDFMASASVTALGENLKGLFGSLDALAKNVATLFGVSVSGSAFGAGINWLIEMLNKAVGLVKEVVDGINNLTTSKDKLGTAKTMAGGALDGFKTEPGPDGQSRVFGGLVGSIIDWFSPGNNPMHATADKWSAAADRMNAAADRLQAPVVVPGGAGGGGPSAPGKAVTPAPTTGNGSAYGAK